jgi:hypothetical protein
VTVLQMIVKQLSEISADGLCFDECGCSIDDLCPCGCLNIDCEAAKKKVVDGNEMFIPLSEKEGS